MLKLGIQSFKLLPGLAVKLVPNFKAKLHHPIKSSGKVTYPGQDVLPLLLFGALLSHHATSRSSLCPEGVGRLSVFGKPCTRPDEPANAPLEGARRWLGRLCRSEAQSPRGGHPEPSLEGILSYCGLATLRPPCLSEQSAGRRVEAPAQHISCASAFTASLSDINAEAPVCGAPAPCVIIEVCGFGRLN